MNNIRVTPDSALATPEAIRARIAQLEQELAAAKDQVDSRRLNGRLRGLRARLQSGGGPADPSLLISKHDLD